MPSSFLTVLLILVLTLGTIESTTAGRSVSGWNSTVNGAWANPALPGQGLFFDYDESTNTLFAGWFSFAPGAGATSSDQHWWTLQGKPVGASVDLTLDQTAGGQFLTEAAVSTTPVGSSRMDLIDCNRVELSYQFMDTALSGSVVLEKLFPRTPEQCGAQTTSLPRAIDSSKTLAITNVHVIPMIDNRLLFDHTIITRDGVITDMGPSAQTTIPDGAVVVDATGRYLMPGINDMHTHLASSISEFQDTFRGHIGWNLPVRVSNTEQSRDSQLMLYLAKGVTTILNVGDFGEPMPEWSRMLKAGELVGPTLYSSHYVRGDRPSCRNGPPHTRANTVEDARMVMSDAAARGYDFLKLYSCAPADSVRVVLEEGPALGLPAIGHFPVDISAAETVVRGMEAVAHVADMHGRDVLPTTDPADLGAAIDLYREHEFSVISTLWIYELIALVWGNNAEGVAEYFSFPEQQYRHPTTIALNLRSLRSGRSGPIGSPRDGILAQVASARLITKTLHDAGIPVLLGTDSPGLLGAAGFTAHDEMRALERAGLDTIDILGIATVNGADFILRHKPDETPFGQLAPGYRADMILLGINPLESIEFENDIQAVVARGFWRSRDWFDDQLTSIAEQYNYQPPVR